jgi:hypothetical protein
MYDTVNFWQNKADIAGGNPFAILPYLSEITERQNKNGYSVTGKIQGYTANVCENGISLKGSLCKSFFETDNIHTLQRGTVKQAIEKLNDCLHIDLSGAKVTRLDIATVIPTKRPPADYYAYLGQKSHFERLQSTKESLYYNNHQRQMIFYDKGKEARAKKMNIPAVWENSNLFRYELRYTKRLNKQLKTDTTASTLYNEKFYRGVLWNYYTEFKTIQKLKNNSFMIDDIKTPKEAQAALFSYLLQKEGQNLVTDFLSELKANNTFPDRKYYTRLKADLNKMLVAKNENKSDLIQELETYIFDTAKHAR